MYPYGCPQCLLSVVSLTQCCKRIRPCDVGLNEVRCAGENLFQHVKGFFVSPQIVQERRGAMQPLRPRRIQTRRFMESTQGKLQLTVLFEKAAMKPNRRPV